MNKDTIYLNYFIKQAKKGGKFEGLNNERLRSFGIDLKFYNGIPEIFSKTKDMISKNPTYQEYGIKIEHYIVSTGFKEEIMGSSVAEDVEYVWGCELIEEGDNDDKVISEIGYTMDNTSKTRAIFEINKGNLDKIRFMVSIF